VLLLSALVARLVASEVQCFRHLATSGVLDVLILVVVCVTVHTVILDMSKLQVCRTPPLQVSLVTLVIRQ